MSMSIISLASMFIWIAVIYELIKPSKEVSWRKTIPLMSAGSLLTLVLTVQAFQNVPFLN
ncbi:hypothetical protein GCM10008983_17570 [Lentibacillus halophilus]|uniref:Uncharacterized protein n=1 Tax=Lentibacillus halophilus TaxID=295065 RepID=A0ABP3J3Y6_9BACI